MTYLTAEQHKRWKDEGLVVYSNSTGSADLASRYLILPDFYNPAETSEMLDRARQLCDDFTIEGHPMVSIQML